MVYYDCESANSELESDTESNPNDDDIVEQIDIEVEEPRHVELPKQLKCCARNLNLIANTDLDNHLKLRDSKMHCSFDKIDLKLKKFWLRNRKSEATKDLSFELCGRQFPARPDGIHTMMLL